jgi:hypothetical protein
MLDFLPLQDLSDLAKIGLFLVVLSFLMTSYRILYFIFSKRTQGTIIDFIKASGSSGKGTVYRPTFKYTTDDGQEFTAYDKLGTNPPAYTVGQQVPIHYNRFKPQSAKITTFKYMFQTPFMLGSTGLFLLVLEFLQK